jgi:microcystin-dependent protein
MSEPFLGEIRLFGFAFAPRGWAFCNGALLAINQNSALFSLLGTTYGGNGQTTFALPDLRSRVPIHWGQSPEGLYFQGQVAGTETVTLLQSQMPAHVHGVAVAHTTASATGVPSPSVILDALDDDQRFRTGADAVPMQSLAGTGGNQPHTNMQPFLVLNFAIATAGIFPSRN